MAATKDIYEQHKENWLLLHRALKYTGGKTIQSGRLENNKWNNLFVYFLFQPYFESAHSIKVLHAPGDPLIVVRQLDFSEGFT